tara:strand:- start:1666 stop:2964 length:1299 start_codon:yes stop_codon:yes gene_type:complete
MARPNVTVIVEDQSFFIPNTESGSLARGGMPSTQGLIQAIGTTAEYKAGLMTLESVADIMSRLNTNEPIHEQTDTALEGDQGFPFYHLTPGSTYNYEHGNSFAGLTYARWSQGPTGAWKNEWWAAHNFLQYGGVLVVAGTGDESSYASGVAALTDKSIALDVVFGATGTSTCSTVATTRGDCVAINNVAPGLAAGSAAFVGNADEFNICVFGQKKHLNISRTTSNDYGTADSPNYITTNIAADVAGCICRNDKLGDMWWSPAGFKRGTILDVVSLIDNPTDSEMDTMYDLKINPVTTFPGEGTVLFGDKTGAESTSTLSRINVSRLFIYLKRTIGAAARDKLFEFNDEITRAAFVNSVVPVLQTIQSRRGIYDYRVVCDETNNTSNIIDSNQFVADVYIKPAKSINFIKLTFTNKNTGDDLTGSLSESGLTP